MSTRRPRKITAHDVSRLATAMTAYAAIDTAEAPTTTETQDRTPTTARWAGIIGMEGLATGDGRYIEPDALTWAVGDEGSNGLPRRIPFRDVEQDVGEHAGAVVVGNIDKIERRKGGVIWAEGDFDLTTDAGKAAYQSVQTGRKTGVSMDLDSVSFEVRVAQELIDEQQALFDSLFDDEADDVEQAPREVDADGRVTVGGMNADDEMMVTTSARVRAATLVAIPAFDEASIEITDVGYDDAPAQDVDESSAEPAENGSERNDLTASGAPVHPPREWFDNPGLREPTPLVVTDEGRVYGHLATWDVCHTASPAGPGICVTAPPSNSNYSRYHTGSLLTAEGDVISTGRITMATGHATKDLTPDLTMAHYDNTGTAVADVRAGEDSIGIWVSGALRPGVTPAQARELRGSPLSGDWRAVDGSLELHAALAVNTPGFPIPRPQGLVASGQLTSLIASGIVVTPQTQTRNVDGLSPADVKYLQRLANRERSNEARALAKRVTAVKASMARKSVEAFAAKRYTERNTDEG